GDDLEAREREVQMANVAAQLKIGPPVFKIIQCEGEGSVQIMQKLGYSLSEYLKQPQVTSQSFEALVDLLVKAVYNNFNHGDVHGQNIFVSKVDKNSQPVEWLFIDFNRSTVASTPEEIVAMIFEYVVQFKEYMQEDVNDDVKEMFEQARDDFM